MAIEVQKQVSRSVAKHAIIRPDDVAGLICKAVGAPADTALVAVNYEDGTLSHYEMSWSETPKARKRKPKAEPQAEPQA